jgi:hypothetical protein
MIVQGFLAFFFFATNQAAFVRRFLQTSSLVAESSNLPRVVLTQIDVNQYRPARRAALQSDQLSNAHSAIDAT